MNRFFSFVFYVSLLVLSLESKSLSAPGFSNTVSHGEAQELRQQALLDILGGDYQVAEDKALMIVRLFPDSPDGYSLLCGIYSLRGDHVKIDTCLQQLAKLDPGRATQLRDLLADMPNDKLRPAILHFESKYHGKALSPDQEEVRTGYLLYLKAGENSPDRYDRAIVNFKNAIRINPDNARAYNLLGACYHGKYRFGTNAAERVNNLHSALSYYEAAARMDKSYLCDLLSLGYSFSAERLTEYLEEISRIVLSIDPDNSDALEWRKNSEMNRSNGNPEQNLQKQPDEEILSPQEILKKSEELRKMERYRQCEYSFSRSPNSPATAYNLAMAYLHKAREDYSGFSEKAESMLLKAIELDPDFLLARYKLGRYYSDNGRNEEATRQFREVQRLDPAYPPLDIRKALEEAQTKYGRLLDY